MRRASVQKLEVLGSTSLAALVQCAAALALWLILPAGAAADAPAAGGGGQDMLTVALSTDIRSTEPGMAWHTNTATVLHHVFEGLVGYRQDLSVGPLLARRYEVSPDGLLYTFHLRRGVPFHNGAELTAHEVVWTWKRYLDPRTRGFCSSWFDGTDRDPARAVHILDVRAVDRYVVTFRLQQRSGLFLHLLSNPKCNIGIAHPASWDARGKWISPIGTGPFRLTRWARARYVDLVRHDQYRAAPGARDGFIGDRTPLVRKVRFISMPEPATAISALASGDVDVVPSIPAHLVHELRAQKRVKVYEGEGLGWSVLLMQTNDPLLKDVRVREAIARAIDLEQLTKISTFGLSRANASVVPRLSRYYGLAHERRIAFDPPRARELLVEAGYDGRPILLQTNRRFEDMYNNAIVIQAMLKAVGLDVRLHMLDYPTQAENFSNGTFQLMSFRYSPRTHPTMGYASILGMKRQNAEAQWDGDSTDLELLNSSALATEEDQSALFAMLHARMLEKVPILGLHNEFLLDATASHVMGYEMWPMDVPRLWGVARRASAARPAAGKRAARLSNGTT